MGREGSEYTVWLLLLLLFYLEGSKLSFESLLIFQEQETKQQKGNHSFKFLLDYINL